MDLVVCCPLENIPCRVPEKFLQNLDSNICLENNMLSDEYYQISLTQYGRTTVVSNHPNDVLT